MKNGKEPQTVRLELSANEKNHVSALHHHHVKCTFETCNIHTLVHQVIRLEAARIKLEHELEASGENTMGTHGVQGLCERCRWTDVDWIKSLARDWSAADK